MKACTSPRLLVLLGLFAVACGLPPKQDIKDMSQDMPPAQDMSADVGDTSDMSDDTRDMPEEDATPDMSDVSDMMDMSDMPPSVPLMGVGALEGMCGVLDPDDLTAAAPLDVANTLDFGDMPFAMDREDELTPGGKRIYEMPNAGGSSKLSELFSFEVLARCELATLLKTESEVMYDPNKPGSITDYLVKIDDLQIGVSVVRAFIFNPNAETFDQKKASELLDRKLKGILSSSERVIDPDTWSKQILHVMVDQAEYMEPLKAALRDDIDADTRSDTIILFTVTEGDDRFIYTNRL